jgi:excisionase family DNA binding protein
MSRRVPLPSGGGKGDETTMQSAGGAYLSDVERGADNGAGRAGECDAGGVEVSRPMQGTADRATLKPMDHAAQRFDRRTPIEDLPEFLSPEEFRRYVGLGRSTVYDLLRRDELPHVRFGRVIRIPKSALQTERVK